MVKERKLAVPYPTVFIAQLPLETREIIREDLRQHAREMGYRLKWDPEAEDYVSMSRRFCDIDGIYMNTQLEFCEPGEDVEAYESSLKRNIILKLPDDDIASLCKKAARVNLTVSQLLENFICDLVDGSITNGSDERMYAEQWFERCWFSIEPAEEFLGYLADRGLVEDVRENWEKLQEYEQEEELDEYDEEEKRLLKAELETLFLEYKRCEKNTLDATLEDGMKKVITWCKECESLMRGCTNMPIQERGR